MENKNDGKEGNPVRPTPSGAAKTPHGVSDKYWKLASESTAVGILAKQTLVPPKKPGLDRQPKTLNALGIGGIMKMKDQDKETSKDKSVRPRPSNLSSDGDNSRQKIRQSESMRRMTSARRSSAKSRASLVGSKPSTGRRDSNVSEGGSRGTDDEDKDWELFSGDNEVFDGDNLMEQDPTFEMAVVEIDVNEAQEEMERTLKKMLSQGRTTEREKTVLADTFGMFLQALVHTQEGEVEAIDHLQTKSGILQTITYFIKTAEELGANLVAPSDEKIEEDDGRGILDDLHGKADDDMSKAAESDEGGERGPNVVKPQKTAQGISVDEMNTTTLRETYLAQKNKLDMQAHLRNIHALELKQVQFEKTLMDLHYSKMVKPADLQREMRDLRKAVTDLQLELSVIQQDSASIQSDTQAQEKALHEDEISTDRLDLEMLTKQMEVQQNSNKPLHLAKEADKEAHKLEQVLDHLEALITRWADGMETIKNFQDQVDLRTIELQSLLKDEGKMYHNRRLSLHDAESLTADMDILLRKEQNLLDKCAACTESIVLAGRNRKKLQEELHHVHNGTNKSQREYQKLERQIKISHDSYTNSKLAYDKMRSAFDTTKPKDDSNNWEKLSKMFQREIINLKMALSNKLEEAFYNATQVERLQGKLNELYDGQIESGKELQDLIRATVRKRRERQEKSEQCIKLEAQVFRLASDKKMQQLLLDDCGRSERDLHKIMFSLRKKYTQLKIERASYMNDLIQARQKLSEQGEKYKICTNEIDSYNNQLLDRTKEIQRAHYLNLNAGLARDSVRNEALRSIVEYRTHRTERDELHLCNDTLRKEVRTQQNEVIAIRQRFEQSIHQSNKAAVNLRERTEEVCTLIEKIKAYEMIILKGSAELTVREIEKSKLEAILDEVKKHLVIITTNQPDEGKIIRQIQTLRNRVYALTHERQELEATVNNVHDVNRRREIRHELIEKRETVELLDGRLSKLEKSLATRDCLSLERDLILKQVDDFTEDAVVKANFLKGHYANEVKILVGLRKALYHTSNRIDGMICETSLATAKAEVTEAKYKKLKTEVDEAEARFEIGLSPSEDMEKEFAHILWREKMINRSNNRPKGFLFKPKTLSGSRIIMERLRPKPKLEPVHTPFLTPVFPVLINCQKRPYRAAVKKRPLTVNKTHLLRTKTGLPLCNMTTF